MSIRLRRYSGLDLEVFDKDRPIAMTKRELETVSKDPTSQTFIRRCGIVDSSRTPINHLIDWADEEFNAIARFCGGNVVSHTWGLYKLNRSIAYGDRRTAGDTRGALPRNYTLAAEVVIVDGEHPYSTTANTIREGCWEYLSSRQGIPYIFDVSSMQFVQGLERVDHQNKTDVHPIYIDLDINRANPQ